MTEQEHDDIRSLIAPYALGALPEDEVLLVRTHILECEECMAEADDHLEVASSLSLTVGSLEPPRGFSDRVVARATETQTDVAPARKQKQKRTWRLVPSLAAGALMVVTVLLAALLVDTRGDLDRNEEALTALVQGTSGTELRGDEGAVARLVPTDKGSTLIVAGLAEAPTGRTYQLWFLNDDADPVSAGVFDVSGDLSLIETDLRFEDYTGAAVTLEPDGGSDEPTGAIVVGSA